MLEELSIADLQAKLSTGELTSVRLAELYLERIRTLDRGPNGINAVIEINPEALQIGQQLDDERAAGRVRGPLHGVPILIKDNIDTHDRMQTTAGSLALEGSIANGDAFIVQRLRAAGALLLGKTNLSEWANWRGKPSVSGWSSRGGLTRNPHALDRTACGSSSGSAAAVAANLCTAAVGTETDGSIICPSQATGIVGLKPTVGLLSRTGIIPISHSQDTAGPMARTVADAAVLLGALAGPDSADPATRRSARKAPQDYSSSLQKDGLRGSRIGVARKMAGTNRRTLEIFDSNVEVLRQAGAILVDPVDVPGYDKFTKSEVEVLSFEFKTGLNRFLATRTSSARVRTLADIIKFNEDHKDKVMPYFGQERMTASQAKGSLSSPKYRRALATARRLARTEGLDVCFRRHRLDAIVVPSGGPAWLIDLANGDAINWDMESTSPPAVAGYPHITVPAGYIFGLPVGLSFIGKAWAEPTLLKLAYAFEQATSIRRPPLFLPTAKLGY